MCDQDSRSLNLDDLIGKVLQKVYTLEEAVDRIYMMNPCKSPVPFKQCVKKALEDCFPDCTGAEPRICVECHKKYKVKKIICAEELIEFCRNFGWRFFDKELSNQKDLDDDRTKGDIDAECKMFDFAREMVLFFIKNSGEIKDKKIKDIVKKNEPSFLGFYNLMTHFKNKYPDQFSTELPAKSSATKVNTFFNNHKNFSKKK